jgi:hypothetical protein
MSDQMKPLSRSTHFEEDRERHWSPESQPYAPADVLLNYLHSGWSLETLASVETFYYAGYRRVDIVHFTLRNGDSILEMPVLSNPAVTRLLEERGMTVLRINGTRNDMD